MNDDIDRCAVSIECARIKHEIIVDARLPAYVEPEVPTAHVIVPLLPRDLQRSKLRVRGIMRGVYFSHLLNHWSVTCGDIVHNVG